MRRKDPKERALNLLTLLRESPRPLSGAEIADEMADSDTPYPEGEDAQRQQLMIDRRAIGDALGIAVRQAYRHGGEAGQTEYWIDERDILLPDLGLEESERLMLSLSLAAVTRHVPYAGEAELKLGAGALEDVPSRSRTCRSTSGSTCPTT